MPEQLFARRRPASTPEPPACQETGRGETGHFWSCSIMFKKIKNNEAGWNISRVPARFEVCHLMSSLQHVTASGPWSFALRWANCLRQSWSRRAAAQALHVVEAFMGFRSEFAGRTWWDGGEDLFNMKTPMVPKTSNFKGLGASDEFPYFSLDAPAWRIVGQNILRERRDEACLPSAWKMEENGGECSIRTLQRRTCLDTCENTVWDPCNWKELKRIETDWADWKGFKRIKKDWKELKRIEKNWKWLNWIEPCWNGLKTIEKALGKIATDWKGLKRIEKDWEELRRIENDWTESNRIEKGWEKLKRLKQNWTGLTRIETDWKGLKRIETDWKGLKKIEKNWKGLKKHWKWLNRIQPDCKGVYPGLKKHWAGLNRIKTDWKGLKKIEQN